MKFQNYINNEINEDTISLLELSSFIDEYPEMNESLGEWGGKLKSALDKMGLHTSKGNAGLLQIIAKASSNVSKLLWHAFMATITGKQEHKDKVIEISNKEVKKEDIVNFLIKLDMLTLHFITGPIHMIDALTGWHIGPKVLKDVGDLIDRAKKAIDNLIFVRNKSDDRTIKDKLSSYIKNIKMLLLGNNET